MSSLTKEKREKKVDVRFTTGEYEQLKSAAKKIDMKVSQYIRKKSLTTDNNFIIREDEKIVKKADIAVWYCEMINAINLVDEKNARMELEKRMEELECLILR